MHQVYSYVLSTVINHHWWWFSLEVL